MQKDDNEQLKADVDRLNALAWAKRISDSPKSFNLSEEALHLAEKINYSTGRAHALKCNGFALVRLSNNEEGLKLLKEAEAIFEMSNDEQGLAVISEYLGIIQRNWGNFSASLGLLKKALQLAQDCNFQESEATTLYQLGVTHKHLGNYEQALDYYHKSLEKSRSLNLEIMVSYCQNVIGAVYFEIEKYDEALEYYKQGLSIRQVSGDKWGEAGSMDNIGSIYIKLKQLNKAEMYCKKSLVISESTDDKRGQANAMFHLAQIYSYTNELQKSEDYLNKSLQLRIGTGDKKGEAESILFQAELMRLKNKHEEDIQKELLLALAISKEINTAELSGRAHWLMYESQKRMLNFEHALKHLELFNSIEKQLHKDAVTQKVSNLKISQAADLAEKEALHFKIKNEELAALNQELTRQKAETDKAYQQLKSTQTQLIQSEKMASLGELTAGIAHEIQNPLNFINNFSDLNIELIEEMKKEFNVGNNEEAFSIAHDIKENEQKINHHGKRADAIVKGMLLHSRTTGGQKELTDINALADEYLRLAYHGLYAKDKSFNAALHTYYDESIGKVNIVPQDIGRVLLNLYNNAFYAVSERKKVLNEIFEPTVWISTKRVDNTVEISIKDNGAGIPQNIVDKIFQPFFTTKPTGQGTGLGLSLAYDIIKAHGGESKVETKEGEGSEFTIQLPAS